MIGNSNKSNSRLRFQQTGFKRQLENARHYRRQPYVVPESRMERFMATLGPGPWYIKAAILVVVFGLAYAVYIPNFLFIKQVTVTGFKIQEQKDVQALVQTYFSENRIKAQQNILFLSKHHLSVFLKENDNGILAVNSIRKKFPNSIEISIQPRISKFFARTSDAQYIISADGYVQESVPATTTTSPHSSLITITLPGEESLFLNSHFVADDLAGLLQTLNTRLPAIIGSQVASFSLENADSIDITANLPNNRRLLFDRKSDMEKVLANLRLLYANLPDDQKNNYDYIDMRFNNRGYLCTKGSSCTQIAAPPLTAASSTVDTIEIKATSTP